MHNCVFQFLITFELMSVSVHTLNPTILPLLKACLQLLFCYCCQCCRRVVHDILLDVIECGFDFRSTSEEYGAWRMTEMSFFTRKDWINCEEWSGALSSCKCQFFEAHMFCQLRQTSSRRRRDNTASYLLVLLVCIREG